MPPVNADGATVKRSLVERWPVSPVLAEVVIDETHDNRGIDIAVYEKDVGVAPSDVPAIDPVTVEVAVVVPLAGLEAVCLCPFH